MGNLIGFLLVVGFGAFAVYLTIGVVNAIRERKKIKNNKKEDKK